MLDPISSCSACQVNRLSSRGLGGLGLRSVHDTPRIQPELLILLKKPTLNTKTVRRGDRGYRQHAYVCVMITCVLTARHTWIGIQ
jgi:hypothetical protein